MRDFQSAAPGRLRSLATGAKILYSAFVISVLVGLVVSWRLYGAAVGDAGPEAYYSGAAVTMGNPQGVPQTPPVAASAAPSAAPAGGPAIDLAPEDAKPKPIVVQMPERKLLEVTHFHVFTIPVLVLILAHLWLLAKIPAWLQNGGVVAAVVTSAMHVAAPWIARGRPGAAFLVGTSGLAMLLTLGVMALWSMVDMWLPNPKQPSTAEMLAELRKKRAAASSSDPGSPA